MQGRRPRRRGSGTVGMVGPCRDEAGFRKWVCRRIPRLGCGQLERLRSAVKRGVGSGKGVREEVVV